jgi:hypothetical protein
VRPAARLFLTRSKAKKHAMNPANRISAITLLLGLGIASFGAGALPLSDRIVASAVAGTASKLGDLSSFRAIVVDTRPWLIGAISRQRRPGSRISRRPGMRRNPH